MEEEENTIETKVIQDEESNTETKNTSSENNEIEGEVKTKRKESESKKQKDTGSRRKKSSGPRRPKLAKENGEEEEGEVKEKEGKEDIATGSQRRKSKTNQFVQQIESNGIEISKKSRKSSTKEKKEEKEINLEEEEEEKEEKEKEKEKEKEEDKEEIKQDIKQEKVIVVNEVIKESTTEQILEIKSGEVVNQSQESSKYTHLKTKSYSLQDVSSEKIDSFTPAFKRLSKTVALDSRRDVSFKRLIATVNGGGPLLFFSLLTALVIFMLAIPLLDMVAWYYTVDANDSLQVPTWGLFYVCFDFGWKVFICYRCYPRALKKKKLFLLYISGCFVHMLLHLGVTLVWYFQLFSNPPGITAAIIINILITILIDLILLPITYNRAHLKYQIESERLERENNLQGGDSDVENGVINGIQNKPGSQKEFEMKEEKKIQEEEEKKQEIGINQVVQTYHLPSFMSYPKWYKSFNFVGAASFLWIFFWTLFTFINFFVYVGYGVSNKVLMDVALWLFGIIATIVLFLQRSKKNIAFGINYLIFYIFAITMMPFFCGSMFNFFRNVAHSSTTQFFTVVAYIVLFEIIIQIVEFSIRRMTEQPFITCFVFPVQFFQYFYSALFFLNLRFSDPTFWATLVLQSIWLGVRNAGLTKDLQKIIYEKFSEKYKQRFQKDFFYPIQFDQGLARIVSQTQQACQYLICDAIALLSVPIQYYLYTELLYKVVSVQNSPEFASQVLACYAKFYSTESQSPELAIRFAVIFAFKMFFHALAFGCLAYKTYIFNKINFTRIHLFGISSAFMRSQFIFICVFAIALQRYAYMIRRSLATSDLEIDFSGCVDPSNPVNPQTDFWYYATFQFILGG